MTSIRPRLTHLVELLSEMNQAPEPPATLVKALDSYAQSVAAAKKLAQEEEKWRDLLAELANIGEESAKRKLDQLSDAEFKAFCMINKIKAGTATKAKTVKGKVIQKKVAAKAGKPAKKATKNKAAQPAQPARPAVPEKREADIVIPAITIRQATTENILIQAARLKSQATI
jgi:hypothetical protein